MSEKPLAFSFSGGYRNGTLEWNRVINHDPA